MEGTIYLKRDRKNKPDTSDSTDQFDGVAGGNNQTYVSKEPEEVVSGDIVDSANGAWVPGFIKEPIRRCN